MPLAAVYTASKMAIEGFSASLALELASFDVKVPAGADAEALARSA